MFYVILNLLSLAGFSFLAVGFHASVFLEDLDVFLNSYVDGLFSVFANNFFLTFSVIGDFMGLLIFSLFLMILLFHKKDLGNFLLLAFGMCGGAVLYVTLKGVFERGRPVNAILQVQDFSFPSGHATMSMILGLFLIYSFKDEIKDKFARWAFVIFVVLMVLLIGFSRLYFKVHWFTDVLAGYSLGIFWFSLLVLLGRLFCREIKD